MNKKSSQPEISHKNTKDQILTAYNEAMKKLSEKQDTRDDQMKLKNARTIDTTSKRIPVDIFSDLTNLKSNMIQQIDELSKNLLSESEKFTKLQEAISHEQTHLQDLYKINETAGSLTALIEAHREEKESFEKQMEQTKTNWQAAKEQLDIDYKEKKAQLEKLRKREEEEYTYQLEIKRRKELDEYNDKKIEIELELVDRISAVDHRERQVTEREKHIDNLQKQVDSIDALLDKKIKQAEESLAKQLKEQFSHESEIKAKDYDATIKLKEQSISYKNDKIAQQEEQIRELKLQSNEASRQVQSIASRALDTSAKRFSIANDESSAKVANKD